MTNKMHRPRFPMWRLDPKGIAEAGVQARERAVFRRRQEASRRRTGEPVHDREALPRWARDDRGRGKR
jgi:hypothetical protein